MNYYFMGKHWKTCFYKSLECRLHPVLGHFICATTLNRRSLLKKLVCSGGASQSSTLLEHWFLSSEEVIWSMHGQSFFAFNGTNSSTQYMFCARWKMMMPHKLCSDLYSIGLLLTDTWIQSRKNWSWCLIWHLFSNMHHLQQKFKELFQLLNCTVIIRIF